MDDLYGILELERGASLEQIKANYRRLAMRWHPDRNGGSVEAEEKFKRISEAWSVLSDEGSRREYDLSLDSGAGGQAEGGRSDRGYSSGFAGFGAFTAEQAAGLFMNEMYNLAIELTMQNVGWRDIAEELTRRGCPAGTAADIARRIELRRKAMVRGNARPALIRAAVSIFFGFMIFGTFRGAGLGILGFIGLLMFLSGAWNLVRAIWFMTTGAAPAR
jgi:curved DNA-binding protein CbpA